MLLRCCLSATQASALKHRFILPTRLPDADSGQDQDPSDETVVADAAQSCAVLLASAPGEDLFELSLGMKQISRCADHS